MNNHKKKKSLPIKEKARENEANEFLKAGDLEKAKNIYEELLNRKYNQYRIYQNLVHIYEGLNEVDKKITILKRLIIITPLVQEFYFNLGNSYEHLNQIGCSIKGFKKAIQINPNYLKANYNLGSILKKNGKYEEAINYLKKSIAINPNYLDAYINLSNTFIEQNKLDDSISILKKAININPNFEIAYINLGNTYQRKGCIKKAISFFKHVISLNPNFIEAYINLGNAFQENGYFNKAISSFNKVIEMNPNYFDAYINLALIQLLVGDYKSGLNNYEFRLNSSLGIANLHAKPKTKKWSGLKKKKKNKLLVVSEQGLGDTLHYMRYIKTLREKGLDVSLCAQKELHQLIKFSGINDDLLTTKFTNSILNKEWIPLLSLPKYLGVNPKNPIVNSPYIFTSKELILKWKKLFNEEKKPIIGINWQGNPNHEKGLSRGRSIELELFSKIAKNKSIRLLSLQKGFGSKQLETCSFQNMFIHCQDKINQTWDFLETAAIIENCNLIITTDTCIAHLAGGMGKQTWLLLKDIPEWRWGIQGESTFWYPSIKLFRQQKRNDWSEVIERVSKELNLEFLPSQIYF